MLCVGARFDDRVTGRLADFSPGSTKIHIDIDPSSINKNVMVDLPVIGDVGHVLEAMNRLWRKRGHSLDKKAMEAWWQQIADWRSRDCLAFRQDGEVIKPQHAIRRLYEMTQGRDLYITTEVGQHQM